MMMEHRAMSPERAVELKNSDLWNDFCREVDSLLASEMAKLRRCSPEDVIKIQARIDVYEFIRNLPQTIVDREA